MGSSYREFQGQRYGQDWLKALDMGGEIICNTYERDAQVWNAALAAVEAEMPSERTITGPHSEADINRTCGWNDYRDAMSERIAALREKPE